MSVTKCNGETVNSNSAQDPAVTDARTARHGTSHVSSVCPTCGHPMASDRTADLFQGAQRQLYECVRDAGQLGISNDQLMSKLYGHRADGGPNTPNIVAVMNWHINRKLRLIGLEVVGRGGPKSTYRLESYDADRPRPPNRKRYRGTT